MNDIVLSTDLKIAAPAAHEAIRYALVGLCERADQGDVSLSAAIHAPGQSELGRVSVAIALESNAAKAHEAEEFTIEIAARSSDAAFPKFHGAIRIEPLDSARSRAILHGSYRVPLGVLGAAANALALDAVAQEGLRGFFTELIAAAEKYVRDQANEAYLRPPGR